MDEINELIADQDAFFLLAFLRAHNGPWAEFMVTNTLAERLGWDRRRLSATRRRLIELRFLTCTRAGRGRGRAAFYRWLKRGNSSRF
jgi:hypothetical protein